MAITQAFKNTYETTDTPAYAAGDLDAQNGYSKTAGAGTRRLFVVASSLLEGAQLLGWRSAGAGTATLYEKALPSARVAQVWRLTWKVYIKSTAALSDDTWIGFTNGAAAANDIPDSKDAITIGLRKATSDVTVLVFDKDNATPGLPASSTTSLPLDTNITLRLDVFADHTYLLSADIANLGQTWNTLMQGSLVAANVTISRFHYVSTTTGGTDDTFLFDKVTQSALTTDAKVALGTRATRYNALTTPFAVLNASTGMIDLTVTTYDGDTGDALTAAHIVSVSATAALADGNADAGAIIDAALLADLRSYDQTAKVATIAASGAGHTA